jgi:hypothetical protein
MDIFVHGMLHEQDALKPIQRYRVRKANEKHSPKILPLHYAYTNIIIIKIEHKAYNTYIYDKKGKVIGVSS